MYMTMKPCEQWSARAGQSWPVRADSDVEEFCKLLVKIHRY